MTGKQINEEMKQQAYRMTSNVQTAKIEGARLKTDENEDSVTAMPIWSHFKQDTPIYIQKMKTKEKRVNSYQKDSQF